MSYSMREIEERLMDALLFRVDFKKVHHLENLDKLYSRAYGKQHLNLLHNAKQDKKYIYIGSTYLCDVFIEKDAENIKDALHFAFEACAKDRVKNEHLHSILPFYHLAPELSAGAVVSARENGIMVLVNENASVYERVIEAGKALNSLFSKDSSSVYQNLLAQAYNNLCFAAAMRALLDMQIALDRLGYEEKVFEAIEQINRQINEDISKCMPLEKFAEKWEKKSSKVVNNAKKKALKAYVSKDRNHECDLV